METILKAYIHEAIEIEKTGLEVDSTKKTNSNFLKNYKKNWIKTKLLKLSLKH